MNHTAFLSTAALFLALAATPASAATPPAIGDPAPDFTLSTTAMGAKVRLHNLTAQGPVVLVVLRGFPGYQCPFCTRQVQDFIRNSAAFMQSGARVLFVYPGPAQDLDMRASEFLKDKQLPDAFTMALDPDYRFTNQYGLRWDAPKETAYPSTFLIDAKGVVFWEKISKEHGGRTTAAEVLDALHKR